LAKPRHPAAARALGLGQILTGESTANGEVKTAFGVVKPATVGKAGSALLLVRPGQARIVASGEGVEAEVVSIELRPPEAREVRRIAVVRVGENTLRLFTDERSVAVGQRVCVRIEDGCELLEE